MPERAERMRRTLVEIAISIRREQVRLGVGPLEYSTPELQRLDALYHRLRPAYSRELGRLERAEGRAE